MVEEVRRCVFAVRIECENVLVIGSPAEHRLHTQKHRRGCHKDVDLMLGCCCTAAAAATEIPLKCGCSSFCVASTAFPKRPPA